MRYRDLLAKTKDTILIKSTDLALMTDNLPYLRRQLSEWTKKEYLIKLKKGFYIPNDSDLIKQIPIFFLSNQLYQPSYISLESALSWYGLIPEKSQTTTAISTKKTTQFQTPIGNFYYHSIKSSGFLGYVQITIKNYKVLIAEPEKALLDLIYLKAPRVDDQFLAWFDQLRLDSSQGFDWTKLNKYANHFGSSQIKQLLSRLEDQYA